MLHQLNENGIKNSISPCKSLCTESFIHSEIVASKFVIDVHEYPSTANGNCVQQYNDRDISSVIGNQPMDIIQRIQYVLESESKAIQSIEVTSTFEDVVNLLMSCRCKLLTTGMGKAGIIANKFAVTLSSTGTPAIYVHPGEAAHGDLGVVSEGDCLVAFSTSGKTREVIEMLELAEHLGLGKVVGITSHAESELRKHCDIILEMGVIEEPCPLGLTPSASIAVMNAIADAITLALMELKGITKHQYGLRHHGGYLGRVARLDNE